MKLSTAIDESEYSAALKELCSVSIMSSFMNASLLLAALSDYNGATRAQIWPCIDLVKDSASVLSARLQRLEMIGVVLVGIQSMIDKLRSHAEKSAALNTKILNSTAGSSLDFLQRHYSDAVSPQLGHARNVNVARRIIATALTIVQSAPATEVVPELDVHVHLATTSAAEDLQSVQTVDELSLESARSSSSQAGGYFVDPSVIVIPSGSVGSASIPLRLNAAGRHEQQVGLPIFVALYLCTGCVPLNLIQFFIFCQPPLFSLEIQASVWRRAYLGRLHREIQGDTPSSNNISAENWVRLALHLIFEYFLALVLFLKKKFACVIFSQALIALREHASQLGHVHADDPDQLLPEHERNIPTPGSVAIRHESSSPMRPRVRRGEDASDGLGISLAVKSSGVVQTNSGLGAALLSVFDDIVAADSSREDILLHSSNPDLDGSKSTGHSEEKLDVDVNCEESSLSSERDELTKLMKADVESESPHSIKTPSASLQDIDFVQNDHVSAFLAQTEHRMSSDTIRGMEQPSPTRIETICQAEHPEAILPPVQGVATPRRAKTMNSGPSSLMTHPPMDTCTTRDQYMQPTGDNEMDM